MGQRWFKGDWTWAPGELARPKDYVIEPLDRGRARLFVETHHYAKSWPSCLEAYGLFQIRPFRAQILQEPELVGVAVFGNAGNEEAIPKYTGAGPRDGADLARFVLDPRVPQNGETLYLKLLKDALREARPNWQGFIAYSDPVPRIKVDGTVILPGHVGGIYKASSAIYHGRGSSRRIYLLPDCRAISAKSLQKIRKGLKGTRYAERQIAAATGLVRRAGESGESFLARVDASGLIRSFMHPGNHVYSFPLNDDGKRGIAAALGLEAADGEGLARLWNRARAASVAVYPQQIDDKVTI